MGTVGAKGYAVARGSVEPDVTGVAAPIRSPSGESIAALSVIGPSYRMPPRVVAQIGREVVAEAQALAAALDG
jgi:DNA-binding IclR family transcriptional regulator